MDLADAGDQLDMDDPIDLHEPVSDFISRPRWEYLLGCIADVQQGFKDGTSTTDGELRFSIQVLHAGADSEAFDISGDPDGPWQCDRQPVGKHYGVRAQRETIREGTMDTDRIFAWVIRPDMSEAKEIQWSAEIDDKTAEALMTEQGRVEWAKALVQSERGKLDQTMRSLGISSADERRLETGNTLEALSLGLGRLIASTTRPPDCGLTRSSQPYKWVTSSQSGAPPYGSLALRRQAQQRRGNR
ncbi:hypothetical protein IAU60_002617 [Kwoniella sp. DSM 27419]